jgi:hypothetical protein
MPDPAANPGMGYQYGDANPMVSLDPSGSVAGAGLQKRSAGLQSGEV